MSIFEFENIDLEVTGIQKFLTSIGKVRKNNIHLGQTWYFRGDKNCKPLCPSAGQNQKYAGKMLKLDTELEKKLLHRFKRFAYPYIGKIQNDWEALCLARHYGLPVRIMDWSSNPLVALYFACSPESEQVSDGVIWGILRIEDEKDDIDIIDPKQDPFQLYESKPAIKLIYPIYNSYRIKAQKGIFSWHSNPHIPLVNYAGQEFDQDKLDIVMLVKWKVADKYHTKLVQELENLGINQRIIFPDIEGTTKSIWQTVVLWDGQ